MIIPIMSSNIPRRDIGVKRHASDWSDSEKPSCKLEALDLVSASGVGNEKLKNKTNFIFEKQNLNNVVWYQSRGFWRQTIKWLIRWPIIYDGLNSHLQNVFEKIEITWAISSVFLFGFTLKILNFGSKITQWLG